ncbi:MAG: hypothetical protein NUW01_05530 [Gemmatimonadaceae bacterium]|nr:hypothetical protein [Gemmatimonadaceae bacterium]
MAGTVTDITPQLTNIEFSTDKGIPDVTTMGFNYRNYLAGIADSKLKLEGIHDPASSTTAGSLLFNLAHGTATQTASWVYAPQGTAAGKQKISGETFVISVSLPSGMDDAVTFSADCQNSGTVTFATY